MPRRAHLIAAILALAGCGFGAVEVEPYEVAPGAQRPCDALLADLPDVVADAVSREVSPSSLPAAAWGRPPIVLRCGVGLPPEYRPDAVLTEFDGVAWLPVEGEGGVFFAAVEREPVVEVAVPDDYPPADVLADLTAPIRDHLPAR